MDPVAFALALKSRIFEWSSTRTALPALANSPGTRGARGIVTGPSGNRWVLIYGSNPDLRMLNTDTNAWTAAAVAVPSPYNMEPDSTNLVQHPTDQTQFFLVGGSTDENNVDPVASAFGVYDIDTGTWTDKADMPHGRMQGGVGVYNGKIYYTGGRGPGRTTNVASMFVYDVAANTWSTDAGFSGITARPAQDGVVNGPYLHLLGGDDSPYDQHYVVDLVLKTTTTKASLAHRNRVGGMTVGGGFVIAGFMGTSPHSLYRFSENLWVSDVTNANIVSYGAGGISARTKDGDIYLYTAPAQLDTTPGVSQTRPMSQELKNLLGYLAAR